MFSRLRGSGRTSGATEKLSPTACPGVGYGSWPTISTLHRVERKSEGAQHMCTRRQIAAPHGKFGAQKVSHRGDLGPDRFQRVGPTVVDQFTKRARRHEPPT